MHTLPRTVLLLASLLCTAGAQAPSGQQPFPPATAASVQLDQKKLESLDARVADLVRKEEIVGAELLVIKDGKTVLHTAHGHMNHESDRRMEPGSVFCVRSMTKPVIAAAIMMLVQGGSVSLDDPVSKHLKEFSAPETAAITIEHLLRHQSGLPLSLIMDRNPRELESIRQVAGLGAGHELEFQPGSAFRYSDQGTDTLTAVIEVASGMPAAAFVRKRILDPLGMSESLCVFPKEHALRERACVKYVGSRGSWTPFWKPDEAPLFRTFLGSQGLYATATDYARFLTFWLRMGRGPEGRLLARRHVRTVLTPSEHADLGAGGFLGLRAGYGGLMQLWTAPANSGSGRSVAAFGHSGSDGTWAWAFPKERALVLYFTQSRGNTTGVQLEETLGQLFLGDLARPPIPQPPLDPFLGYYRENAADLHRAIIRHDDGLALEILGRAVVPLRYLGEDRWSLRPQPRTVLAFQRTAAGEITGFRIGDHEEHRFTPAEDLPSGASVAARVRKAHGLDRLAKRGPLRLRGTLEMDRPRVKGSWASTLVWPDRFHLKSTVGTVVEQVGVIGQEVWYGSSQKAVARMKDNQARSARRDTPLARCGDWNRWFPAARVVQALEREGGRVLVVRFGDTSAPAPTLFVNEATGHVVAQLGMAHLPGLGEIGQRVFFSDFREVDGMTLPFRTEVRHASRLLGTVVLTTEAHADPGAQPDALFRLEDG